MSEPLVERAEQYLATELVTSGYREAERDVLRGLLELVVRLTQERDALKAQYEQLVLAGTFHQDCRPNRQQAQAWLADAKAMNDKWADEVTAHRETKAQLAAAEAARLALQQERDDLQIREHVTHCLLADLNAQKEFSHDMQARVDAVLIQCKNLHCEELKQSVLKQYQAEAALQTLRTQIGWFMCVECLDEHGQNTQSISCYCRCHSSSRDEKEWPARREQLREALK